MKTARPLNAIALLEVMKFELARRHLGNLLLGVHASQVLDEVTGET